VDAVLKAAAIYLVMMAIMRVVPRRTLAQSSPFELVLLIMVGEATESALAGENHSVINAILVVATLMGINTLAIAWQHRSHAVKKAVEGMPILLLENGRPLKEQLDAAHLDEEDIMSAAREMHGLDRLEQIRFAILEVNGNVSVIPWPGLERRVPSQQQLPRAA